LTSSLRETVRYHEGLRKMTTAEKLNRDIDTLSQSVHLDSKDLANLKLTDDDKAAMISHIDLCIEELMALRMRLDGSEMLV